MDSLNSYANDANNHLHSLMNKYEISYGTMHPIFLYFLVFSTIIFLSVCNPPEFYKRFISWIMRRKVRILNTNFVIY